jgi:hypothetical protein
VKETQALQGTRSEVHQESGDDQRNIIAAWQRRSNILLSEVKGFQHLGLETPDLQQVFPFTCFHSLPVTEFFFGLGLTGKSVDISIVYKINWSITVTPRVCGPYV